MCAVCSSTWGRLCLACILRSQAGSLRATWPVLVLRIPKIWLSFEHGHLRPEFFQFLSHFADMAFDLHFRPDGSNLTGLIDQKRGSLDAHRLLPVHVFLDPDAILFGDCVIFVCQ